MLDLQNIDLKVEVNKLRTQDPGETRGSYVKALVDYLKIKITSEKGKEGYKKLEMELKKVGLDLGDVDRIGGMNWVPSNLDTIVLLVAGKIFNWKEADYFTIGKDLYSFAPTLKIFIKYFVSYKKTFEKAARDWRKHYTFGELEVVECNKKEHRLVIRKKGDKRHPLLCPFHLGIFVKVAELATGSKVEAKEKKCMFDGYPYHEFILTW